MFLLDELLAALKEFENNAEEVAQLLQNKESKVHVLYLQIVPGVGRTSWSDKVDWISAHIIQRLSEYIYIYIFFGVGAPGFPLFLPPK